MKRFTSIKAIFTVLTLSLLLISWAPTAVSSPEIRIDFIGWGGPPAPGTIVDLGGSGATALGEVEILFDNMSVALTQADPRGFFFAFFEIPDVPPGEYTVTAVDIASGDTASAPFEVVEREITIFTYPERGYVGTTVNVYGELVTPGGVVEIYFDETLVAGTTADPFGFYLTLFTLPEVPPGVYRVTALDVESGISATAFFEVLPPPELSISPSEGPMGTKVTVSGKSFVPPSPGSPSILVSFEDQPLAYGRLDENGDFTAVMIVPAVVTGSYEVKAAFEPWTPLASATFTVTFGMDSLFAQLDEMGSDIAALNAKITSLEEGVATIETDVGTLKVDITALNAVITSVEGDVATLTTDLGELKGRVTSIEEGIATIETDVGTLKVEVPQQFESLMESMQEQFGSVIMYELAVATLALIAAVGAWIAVIIVWRRSKVGP